MAKLTTSDLVSLANETSAVTTINNNFTAVETAMENTLSRDGTTPNTMSADLDMNTFHILNLGAPMTDTEPLRVTDLGQYLEDGQATAINPTSGDTNKLLKALSAGIVGFTNIEVDANKNLYPTTNNDGALGTSSKAWADLFLASGGIINFASGDVLITHSTDTLTVSGGTVVTAPGTATVPPLRLQAGTNLTTAAAGAIEFDGKAMYSTMAASSRGVIPSEQILILASDYTLTGGTTAAQKLFNASTNGAITVQANTTYLFDGLINITGMSTTSGNASILIDSGGTAIPTTLKYMVIGYDGAASTATAASAVWYDADGSGNSVVAGTSSVMSFYIRGVVRIGATGGTLIPSIALTTAATAVVQDGSFIKFTPIGSDSVATVGNWS